MWGKLVSVFKGKGKEDGKTRPANRRHFSTPADPFGDSTEEDITSPSNEDRDDAGIRIHHSLEQALGREPPDEDALDAEDDAEDIPVRHHNTLEENIELARKLSQELQRQSEDLRRSSSSNVHTTGRSDKTQ